MGRSYAETPFRSLPQPQSSEQDGKVACVLCAQPQWRIALRPPLVPTGRRATVTRFYSGRVSDGRSFNCSCIFQLPSTEWFPQMGSRLVELQLSRLSATPHNVTSLLPTLSRLIDLKIYDLVPMDEEETNLPTISQVPFFQDANHSILYPNYCGNYPSWLLNWVPSSAWLAQL